MVLLWEEKSLLDREAIFDFLYQFNPLAAEKTDDLIEAKVSMLLSNPLIGVKKEGIRGRCFIIPDVSLLVFYDVTGDMIRIMRVLHQKQKYPDMS